jgi:hypothetical protein
MKKVPLIVGLVVLAASLIFNAYILFQMTQGYKQSLMIKGFQQCQTEVGNAIKEGKLVATEKK